VVTYVLEVWSPNFERAKSYVVCKLFVPASASAEVNVGHVKERRWVPANFFTIQLRPTLKGH